MNIKEKLINLGFNKKEADVYLACLQLGEGLITDISEAAKIKRPTTYNIIEALIQKGVVQKNVTSTRTFYQAESPEKLLKIYEKNKKEFEESLPELDAIYNFQKGVPQIKYYEGVDAIKEVYAKLMNQKDLLFITPVQEYKKRFPELYKLHSKVLAHANGKEKIIKRKFSCAQIITNNKKFIISWNKNISVIEISSYNIVELDRYLFHVEHFDSRIRSML
ncbi:hypothetical protein KKC88_06495 [Patescibacteria group bacterium]|nr:hypothetical protein [Patescibacteria group bacterium]MBU1673738.1 hypothetical protein [Patescibacteria group bacterium]MBU1963104.1 hypothetical protein [Patescibacteria group bacterium]